MECQVLLNTLLMAAEYDRQRYSAMSSYADAAEAYVAKMDNGYIKIVYACSIWNELRTLSCMPMKLIAVELRAMPL